MSGVVNWLQESHASVHRLLDSVEIPRWMIPVGVAAVVAGVGGTLVYTNPALFVKATIKYVLRKAGLSVNYVKGKKETFCYAERGQLRSDQPTLLFISGYLGTKVDWADCIQGIQQDVHIVLLDLPGHGGSSVPSDPSDIDMHVLRDNIAEFMYLLNLDVVGVHLVGLSMGGLLSGLVAAKYPNLINRVTIMCPAITCPIETEAWQNLSNVTSESFSGDVSKFQEYMETTAAFPPQSYWLWKGISQVALANRSYTDPLMDELLRYSGKESQKCEEILSTIKVPTQIVWGENDLVLHVSGASMLEELIPSVKRVDILPCGHVIFLELPKETSQLVTDFYNTTYSS